MIKTGRRTGALTGPRKPSWISDKENQRKWNDQFIKILKEYYLNSDSTISAIWANERLSQICATKIRSYVDKGCTTWWYRNSKARGAEQKRRYGLAIAGLNAAVGLYLERGEQATAQCLNKLATGLSHEIGHFRAAFATKPHGRDRDHSFLLECRSFLQAELGQPVTYATLANLVNAGYEADGNPLKKPITEEHIRKNLANFERNNPSWRLYSMK